MLKNLTLACIAVSVLSIMSCRNDSQQNNSQQIDLHEYKNLFSSRDIIIFTYWRFFYYGSEYEDYIHKKFIAFENIDSLNRDIRFDHIKVFAGERSYRFSRLNEHEIAFHGINRSGWIFKFLSDTIQIVDFIDSNTVVSTYSFPAKITTGSSYVSGNLTFLKTETLQFGTTKIECLVVSCSSNRGSVKWTFWLNPKKLFVKIKISDDRNNNELLILEKNSLFSSLL